MTRVVLIGVLLLGLFQFGDGQKFIKTASNEMTVNEFLGTASPVTFNGTAYVVASFRGIRYAMPPSGNRRFAKPEPYTYNETLYNATQVGNICHQPASLDSCQKGQRMNEDCLFLNVFVPLQNMTASELNSSTTALLPVYAGPPKAVFVFIHGGGFYEGNGNCQDASIFSAYGDIVVVTINYRLGALGFLSTDDGKIPANLGLWDQREAIKWVKKYIVAFGGDPTKITIGGQSAGGFSTIYQGLYQENDKLFRGMISQSGHPAAPKSTTKSGYNTALRLANLLGCNISGLGKGQDIKACLMNVSATTFPNTVLPLSVPLSLVYGPTVDGEFIPQDPYDLIKNALGSNNATALPYGFLNKDLLVGLTSEDGEVIYRVRALFISNEAKNRTIILDALNQPISMTTLRTIVTESFSNSFGDTIDDLILQAVLDRYVDWGKLNDPLSISYQTVKFLTDIGFAIPIANTALVASIARDSNSSMPGKTYVYKLSLPSNNVNYQTNMLAWLNGTSHSDDMPMLFGKVNDGQSFDISKSVMTYWSNFIKTGNPNTPGQDPNVTNVETPWPAFSTVARKYLDISSPCVVKQQLASENQHFWYDFIPRLVSRVSLNTTTATTQQTTCENNNNASSGKRLAFSSVIITIATWLIPMATS